MRPRDLLHGPHVSAQLEQRADLDALVQSLEREGGRDAPAGGGAEGDVRLVRTDAVLLGIKSAVCPRLRVRAVGWLVEAGRGDRAGGPEDLGRLRAGVAAAPACPGWRRGGPES